MRVTFVVGAVSISWLTPLGCFQLMVVVILCRDVSEVTNRLRIVRQILAILLLIVLLNPKIFSLVNSTFRGNNLAQKQPLNINSYFLVILKTQYIYHLICLWLTRFKWLLNKRYVQFDPWFHCGLFLGNKYLFFQCDILLLIKWKLFLSSIKLADVGQRNCFVCYRTANPNQLHKWGNAVFR